MFLLLEVKRAIIARPFPNHGKRQLLAIYDTYWHLGDQDGRRRRLRWLFILTLPLQVLWTTAFVTVSSHAPHPYLPMVYALTMLVVSVLIISRVMALVAFDALAEDEEPGLDRLVAGSMVLILILCILFMPALLIVVLGVGSSIYAEETKYRVQAAGRELSPADICRDPRYEPVTQVIEVLAGCNSLRAALVRAKALNTRSDEGIRRQMIWVEHWEGSSWHALIDLAASFESNPLGRPLQVVPEEWRQFADIAKSQLEGMARLRRGEDPGSTLWR